MRSVTTGQGIDASESRAALVLAAALMVLTAAPAVTAQDDPPAPPRPVATEIDLGLAFMDFERTLRAHPLDEADIAPVNRAFDSAAAAFFSRNFGAAVRRIRELTFARQGAGDPTADELAAASLRVRLVPDVFVPGGDEQPRLVATSVYAAEQAAGRTIDFSLVLRRSDEADQPVRLPFNVTWDERGVASGVSAPLRTLPSALPTGDYEMTLAASSRIAVPMGTWTVVDRPLAESRADLERTLDSVNDPSLARAVAMARSRASLLSDESAMSNLNLALIRRASLRHEVEADVQAITSGRDPFRGRVGDWWVTLTLSETTVPCRIYAPAASAESKPMPLLIALHGAGGNEHMFFEAYGGGVIRNLADRHGFIVVSPLTYPFTMRGALAGDLIDAMRGLYEIDDDRVYVVGHSMGAMATAGIARRIGDRLAGVCLIAGGGMAGPRGGANDGAPSSPPALIYAAEIDFLMNAAGAQRAAEQARAAGADIEFRLARDQGHVLVVGAVLPEAVAWLMERKRQR
ncbi:MAG: alpha/beta fold hydrolase [Phycisphaeraceae bacterium]|nr:MAG: alpha/beta fold hydrolase [Phycisphaeraceae bacterium]